MAKARRLPVLDADARDALRARRSQTPAAKPLTRREREATGKTTVQLFKVTREALANIARRGGYSDADAVIYALVRLAGRRAGTWASRRGE